ncbi:RING-H2 finger protein ATL8-like [Nymphaea colorata]|uniref:RING-H2 finger protein ATL8-like n=1 Tax=Nymphaea colorata TaxID=210225 RepID=UPI00129DFD50|nr:RING-H2 finger protein ATL8-like [Nymphaea colorata]
MPLSHSISGARLSRRLLADPPASTGGGSVEQPNGAVNSDAVVILAALLCTLICLVGLGFMARCACWCPFLRRFGIGRRDNDNDDYDDAEANKGLKKKAIRALPVAAFDGGAGKSTDCAICLSEFLTGEQVRVLPRCGHCFHPSCIDTWLASHSSCPSCRLLLSRKAAAPPPPPPPPPPPTVRRCQRCGLPENCSPAPAPDAGAGGAVRSVDQESSAEKVIR